MTVHLEKNYYLFVKFSLQDMFRDCREKVNGKKETWIRKRKRQRNRNIDMKGKTET